MGIVKKNRPGRPSSINNSVIAKLEIAFSYGCNVREALVIAGVSKDAYYRLLEREPKFRERFKLLQEFPLLMAKRNIAEAIFGGDLQISRWYLEKRDSEFR